MSTTPTDTWRMWGRRRWNEELFRHYFVAEDGDPRPVRRLVIGPDELVRVAGGGMEATEVQKAFEDAVRQGCTVEELKRRLSLQPHRFWSRQGIPPYTVDLLFTCYAAGLVDEETVDVGDFRERLRVLLRHPEGQRYHLPELSALWERFAAWLEDQRSDGAPYRALILPDYGNENLIGYSKRLVFPLLRDRRALISVLAEAEVGREPPLRDVLALLAQERKRFTAQFQAAIERAHAAYRNAQADHEDLDVLWSAVREAAILVEDHDQTAAVRYQLFATLDEEFRGDLVLMASAEPERVPRGLRVERSLVPMAGYHYTVVHSTGSHPGTASAVRLFLLDAIDSSLAGFERSIPAKIVKQGILLFKVGPGGVRELVAHRPDDDRVWALVADKWVDPLVDLFPETHRPRVRPSRFDGWQEVGPFEGAYLANVDGSSHSPLAQHRCLQPTRVGPTLHLAGGVRVEGGYLSLRGVLPTVRAVGADRVAVYALRKPNVELAATLIASPDDPNTFRFPRDVGDGWDGRFNLVAFRHEKAMATRQVVFRPRALGLPLLGASEPGRYWVEGARTDVASAADERASLPWRIDVVDEGSALAASRHDQHRRTTRDVQRGFAPAAVAEPPRELRIEDDEGVDRFVEWAAGVATVRRGFTEGELLEMADECLGTPRGGERWDILRAWAEAGFFDILMRRDWRGRTWFARQPLLVVVREAPEVVLGLVGLAGWAQRRRVEKTLSDHDAVPLPGYSFDGRVPPVPRWIMPSLDVGVQAARALEFEPPPKLRGLTAVAMRAASIRERSIGELPQSGELHGTWDWERGRFDPHAAMPAHGTVVEWWQRSDAPDYFVVRSITRPPWWTPSRNWALLVAYAIAERLPYTKAGERYLVRSREGGPHLPLPVARVLVLQSGVSSGPCLITDAGPRYAYSAAGERDREALIECLWGAEHGHDKRLARRIQWLLAAAAASRGSVRGAPGDLPRRLPASLRAALLEMNDVSGTSALADAPVPAHLVPQIRSLLTRSAR